jgi:glycosyltransferase involved in cell wall biosynthesis
VKILFYYYRGGGGGLSNVVLLLQALARCHPEDTIEIVSHSPDGFASLNGVPNIRLRTLRVTGLLEVDRFLVGLIGLPALARDESVDVLWSINLGPYVRPRVPSVISVHNPYQVYPFEAARYHPRSRWAVAVLRWFFRRSLAAADGVIFQTADMRDQLRRVARLPEHVCVAPKSVERETDVAFEPLPRALDAAVNHGLAPDAFTFLYVATGTPHKNHVVLLRALSILARRNRQVRVVFTLRRDEVLSLDCSESRYLIESGVVVPVGPVAKVHLKSLYEASQGCLMPSVLESLSSSHLEAMQWGRPQIVADLPYAREVCGDAALYASPDDPHGWVEQIERLIQSRALQQQLIAAGRAQMARYPASWDAASEIVHDFLDAARLRTVRRAASNGPITTPQHRAS